MTFEEFLAQNKLISKKLDWIADRTGNMAWLRIANSNNPDFVELMNLQKQLLDKAERLITQFESTPPQ